MCIFLKLRCAKMYTASEHRAQSQWHLRRLVRRISPPPFSCGSCLRIPPRVQQQNIHHTAHDAPRSGEKKMIYRTVTEEDGSKNTMTFRPADLHDNQNGADSSPWGVGWCDRSTSPKDGARRGRTRRRRRSLNPPGPLLLRHQVRSGTIRDKLPS